MVKNNLTLTVTNPKHPHMPHGRSLKSLAAHLCLVLHWPPSCLKLLQKRIVKVSQHSQKTPNCPLCQNQNKRMAVENRKTLKSAQFTAGKNRKDRQANIKTKARLDVWCTYSHWGSLYMRRMTMETIEWQRGPIRDKLFSHYSARGCASHAHTHVHKHSCGLCANMISKHTGKTALCMLWQVH